MPDLPQHPDLLATLALGLAILVLFGAFIHAINRHGRRLDRHREWLLILESRVATGDGERQSRNVQLLTPRPPPLDGARTIEIDEAMLETQPDKTRVRPAKPKDTQ